MPDEADEPAMAEDTTPRINVQDVAKALAARKAHLESVVRSNREAKARAQRRIDEAKAELRDVSRMLTASRPPARRAKAQTKAAK